MSDRAALTDTLVECEGLKWLVPRWTAPPRVRALSTLRPGGMSQAPFESLNLGAHVGDLADAVSGNRRTLRARACLPAEPSWLIQVHGSQVVDLDAQPCLVPGAALPQGDAAVTRRVGRICAIMTADCLPVLFAARDGSVVGAAHAGWRGLAAGVLEASLQVMKVDPAQMVAWLGPAIGPAHFEVGGEVREALLASDIGGEAAFTLNARGRYMANIWELARRRLMSAGVSEVTGGGHCTYGDPASYYSHRRDGQSGRLATLIWLE